MVLKEELSLTSSSPAKHSPGLGQSSSIATTSQPLSATAFPYSNNRNAMPPSYNDSVLSSSSSSPSSNPPDPESFPLPLRHIRIIHSDKKLISNLTLDPTVSQPLPPEFFQPPKKGPGKHLTRFPPEDAACSAYLYAKEKSRVRIWVRNMKMLQPHERCRIEVHTRRDPSRIEVYFDSPPRNVDIFVTNSRETLTLILPKEFSASFVYRDLGRGGKLKLSKMIKRRLLVWSKEAESAVEGRLGEEGSSNSLRVENKRENVKIFEADEDVGDCKVG